MLTYVGARPKRRDVSYVLRVLLIMAMVVAGCADDADPLDSSGDSSISNDTAPGGSGAHAPRSSQLTLPSPGGSTVGSTAGSASSTATSAADSGGPSTTGSTTGSTTSRPPATGPPVEVDAYLATRPAGAGLPDDETCRQAVLAVDSAENRGDNATANNMVVPVPGGLAIDGADGVWNTAFAPRITGDFTGTTEQILRWGACKWGFDEDLTRARAVAESSWRMSTQGDRTDDASACGLIGLGAPCAQSYGLLQVKATVHGDTYPATTQSTAFGVDYAMAWLRACYEGSFTWLDDQGYQAGDELGCVGTWFSGKWRDSAANDYVETVNSHLDTRTWERYS